MTRIRAILLLLVVFLTGAAAGAVGASAWVRHRTGAGGLLSGRVERVMVRRIARRLDLDPSQRAILQRAATDARGRMDEVRLRAFEQVRDILDEAFDQLEPTLRPDQKTELARLRRDARSGFGRHKRPD